MNSDISQTKQELYLPLAGLSPQSLPSVAVADMARADQEGIQSTLPSPGEDTARDQARERMAVSFGASILRSVSL